MQQSVKKMRKDELISIALREVFLHEVSHWFSGILVTVTNVHVCKKTQVARVYVSFMPSHSNQQNIRLLEQYTHKIYHILTQRLAKKLRRMPELKFYLDESVEKAFFMQRLLADYQVSTHKASLNISPQVG
jgi:ribosome-binding factor A